MTSPIATYHPITRTIFFCITIILCSCVTKKSITSEPSAIESDQKLIFLNYTIKKNNDNNKQATLINKIVTDGKLKINNQKFTKTPAVGDLKCSQLNKNSVELNHVFVKNPLVKVIETLNDSLSFSRQNIEQNNAPLSLKLQLHPQTQYVTLNHITDSLQNTVELIKTAIK